ncbi:MAG: glycosyltransferase family 4 protein [Actinobacteria bacterium]|nr:glycosyltransferase family 4 protein [Actinomycetota bacterium]
MMRVAFDTGPLHGPITGVGRAVEAMASHSTVDLVPYVLSFRAALRADTVRLPYPAALALRAWGRFDRPRPDHRLRDVDVIHGTNYVVPPSRHPRLVSVYDCWALDQPEGVHRDIGLMMNVLRRAVGSGAHVHASSHATADRLRAHFPDAPITVIHLGTPNAMSPNSDRGRDITGGDITGGDITGGDITGGDITGGVPYDGNVIVSIGTLERRKNLAFLVSLMDDLIGVVPSARLVIAGGDGDGSAAVHAAVNRLGSAARERVHVLGRVDDAEIGRLYHRANVVAYPSLDEGFGFPVLEAMAEGVPVVASAVGSIPEVAGDAALLCPSGDRVTWIESLVTALTDDVRRARMIESGRQRTALFDWSRTARELEHLYRDLANGA